MLVLLALVLATPGSDAELALTSLKSGERARVEAALGDATKLPLYRADFTVDPLKRKIAGRLALTVTPKQATATLLLRCTPNAEYPGAVVLSKAKVATGTVLLSAPEPSLYRLDFDPPLPGGERSTVELALKAEVPELQADGNMLSALQNESSGGDYGAYSASGDVVSLVGLMPMLAPARNGKVFEGPSGIGDLGSFDPSNFVVTVSAPSAWTVVSAGARGGASGSSYALAAAREFPLLLLRNAKVSRKSVGGVEIESILLSGGQGAAVTEHAGNALQTLEQRLGPYPYQTLRVVEMRLVNGAGGMEFPGLITVSASLLSGGANPLDMLGLSGEQKAMASALYGDALKQMMQNTLEFTIDHEVAHQYSAMLVGSDPVAEPIADEPLTQHLALLLLEWRKGKAAAAQMREGQLKAAYQMHRMLGGADAKANRPTSGYTSNREYAAMIYGKAPLLFDELRKEVGDDAWVAGLKGYFDTYRYRWVTAQTLTSFMTKGNEGRRRKFDALRTRWWEEAHGDEDIGSFDLEGAANGKGMDIDPDAEKNFDAQLKDLMGN